MSRPQRLLLLATCLLCTLCAGTVCAKSDSDVRAALREAFAESIRRVEVATVVCLPHQPKYQPVPCSGVILSKGGVILTSDAVGISIATQEKPGLHRSRRVVVRIPRADGRGHLEYMGDVIYRAKNLDMAIVVVEKVGLANFSALQWGDSQKVELGAFALTAGITLGDGSDALPAVNLGIISAIEPTAEGDADREWLFTDGTMYPGMHGGPVTDVNGNLIGMLAWKADAVHARLYGGLHPVIPAARLRREFLREDVRPQLARGKVASAMRRSVRSRGGTTPAHAVQAAVHEAASRALSSVVSLSVDRPGETQDTEFVGGKVVALPRHKGGYSGVVVTDDRHIVTSLYNLATPAFLFGASLSDKARTELDKELRRIRHFRIRAANGGKWRGRLVGYDAGLGVAVIKADPQPKGPLAFPPPAARANSSLRVPGRFTVAVGRPMMNGEAPTQVCTWGILSRLHGRAYRVPWAGQWQTDAGVIDANCGGAAVDLEGRLLGMPTIWSPARHGRNSGVGFIVDADALMEVVRRFR